MSGRRQARSILLAGCVLSAISLTAATSMPNGDPAPGAAADDIVQFTDRQKRRILTMSPLRSLPPSPTNRYADDSAAARFGRYLFFHTGFSVNGEVSCATCHDPQRSFADGRSLAQGLHQTTRHAPALWNVAHNRWYFWDGRKDTLWSQALGPMEDPREYGSNRMRIVRRVIENPPLARAYESIFGPLPDVSDPDRFPTDARPISVDPAHPENVAWESMDEDDRIAINRAFANLGKAIEAYERQIISDDSPFDRFVRALREGDVEAMRVLSPSAQRGLQMFVDSAGCRTCHHGPNLTDGEFHSVGAPPLGGGAPRDPGRQRGVQILLSDPFNAAGRYSDQSDGAAADKIRTIASGPGAAGQFKTPSLRNVAKTAPYMHQGQFKTLRDVLHFYSTREGAVMPGHHQELILEPLNLTEQQTADLLAFLESLTDEALPPALLCPPESPGTPEKE